MVKPKILLTNIGSLDNPGIVMMITAITENVDAEYYYHRLTVCKGYEEYGIKGSWKPYGYDIALDLGGDTFTTYYGTLQFLRHILHLLLLIICDQRFVLFAQTFSPYGYYTRRIAKFIMKRATFITVREQKSLELLEEYGIPGVLTADIAFLLNDWKSEDYDGHSYHRVIAAKLADKSAIWDGSRAENWKFTLFLNPLEMNMMRRKAFENIEMLHRVL